MKVAQFAITVAVAAVVSGVVLQAQSVTDGQIAAIVVTANQVDVDAGKVAEAKGTHSEVKAFGRQMAADHSGVNKQAAALAAKLGLKPEDNPTAQSLKSGGEANVKKLQALTGAAFDRAYIDNEVAYHRQVLEALDTTLIPSAQNAELKALLEKVRPAFVAHLSHAQAIQKVLAK